MRLSHEDRGSRVSLVSDKARGSEVRRGLTSSMRGERGFLARTRDCLRRSICIGSIIRACCKKSQTKISSNSPQLLDDDYYDDSNSEDEEEQILNEQLRQNLEIMTDEERGRHLLELWQKAYRKARGASILLNQLEALRLKINVFGRQLLVNQSKNSIQEESIPKSCKYIIMPTDKFKLYWNIIIILMLFYTATYMPY